MALQLGLAHFVPLICPLHFFNLQVSHLYSFPIAAGPDVHKPTSLKQSEMSETILLD